MPLQNPRLNLFAILVALLTAACTGDSTVSGQDAASDEQWALLSGFELVTDTEGYAFPTSVVFIPNPGETDASPLYFVSELRGAIKVVTRDRTVYDFATVPAYDPSAAGFRELPDGEGQGGLGALCLDPVHGYAFATYLYTGEDGIVRNGVVRFDSEPEQFGLQASGSTEIGAFLGTEPSGAAHQIGGCAVAGDSLYLGVGDGWQSGISQFRDRLVGKTLRLTLDGEPHPDNPFYDYETHSLDEAAQYVYSFGHRNPFGLVVVDEVLFTVENGVDIDRFVRVEAGRNYLWDGDDLAIGAAADAVFAPGVSPVQLDYLPEDSELLPVRYRGRFFLATSKSDRAGVMMLGYDWDRRSVDEKPSYFVQWLGGGELGVTATAFGPDGLYFARILPDASGASPLYKVVPNEAANHDALIGASGDLIASSGCLGCHVRKGEGGNVGPPLNFDEVYLERLTERLSSEEYSARVAEVDRLDEAPFNQYTEARQEVLQAEGRDKVRTWLEYRLQEPRFDHPSSQMPNLGLSEEEAERIAALLLSDAEGSGDALTAAGDGLVARVGNGLRDAVPFFPRSRAGDFMAGVFLGGIGGTITGAAALAAIGALFMRFRKR